MSATTATERVLLADVRERELSADELLSLVRSPSCGAIVTFLGLVRDHDHGEDVAELDYSAHPSARQRLHEVCADIAAAHPQVRLAAVHRVGHLLVGDLAVVVAAAAPHRAQAFDACRDLIDTLKAAVPIWKHQVFQDGRDEWVGIT
ncbi:MAG: molybdenum cofactor biosynthesis protein MoaE [Nostocoides sp.]